MIDRAIVDEHVGSNERLDAAQSEEHRRADDVADAAPASAGFDADAYRHHLDEWAITDTEKDELLRTLWNIMCAFVDLGWGVDAVSMVFRPTSPCDDNTPRLNRESQPPACDDTVARSPP